MPLGDGRGMPHPPDHAADEQGFPLSERQQARQQEPAPAKFFPQGEEHIDQGCKKKGLEDLDQHQCAGWHRQLRACLFHLLLYEGEFQLQLTVWASNDAHDNPTDAYPVYKRVTLFQNEYQKARCGPRGKITPI